MGEIKKVFFRIFLKMAVTRRLLSDVAYVLPMR
jgi:hypothetical protein